MSKMNWLKVMLVVCVCGLMTVGCRTKKPMPIVTGNETPEIKGDQPLPERPIRAGCVKGFFVLLSSACL